MNNARDITATPTQTVPTGASVVMLGAAIVTMADSAKAALRR